MFACILYPLWTYHWLWKGDSWTPPYIVYDKVGCTMQKLVTLFWPWTPKLHNSIFVLEDSSQHHSIKPLFTQKRQYVLHIFCKICFAHFQFVLHIFCKICASSCGHIFLWSQFESCRHACLPAYVCVPVWREGGGIKLILWVKRSKFELIWHHSSCSSEKFNSIVEKGANLNLTQHESSHS